MKNVLAISYAVRVLEPGSREQLRMCEFSKTLDRYVMIVVTRADSPWPAEFHTDTLSVYGTNAKTNLGVLWKGYWLGRRVLRSTPGEEWVVSAQDPFQTSLIAWPLSWMRNTWLHIQIHGDNFGNAAWREESPRRKLQLWFGIRMLRQAKKIRVVSERIKQAIHELGIITEKIIVLPVQVKLGPFLEAGALVSHLRTDTTRFIYVGRFEKVKRLRVLLEAFAQFHTEHPKATLTLLGDGSTIEQVQTWITALGLSEVVEVIKWSNDVPAVLAKHDVFVLASRHEGYSLVLLEALAVGLPVITTDVGCVGELVKDQQHGVVSMPTPEDFAAALAMMTDTSLRATYGAAGRALAAAVMADQADYPEQWSNSFFRSS